MTMQPFPFANVPKHQQGKVVGTRISVFGLSKETTPKRKVMKWIFSHFFVPRRIGPRMHCTEPHSFRLYEYI